MKQQRKPRRGVEHGRGFTEETFVSSLGGVPAGDGTWVRSIVDIEVGDEVLSRDDVTGETAYKPVSKVFCSGDKTVFRVVCEHSELFKRRYPSPLEIFVTSEYPFRVKGKGWVKVCDLEKGDELVTYDDDKLTFIKTEEFAHKLLVYSIEVEDFHTYFVGFEGTWVHD